MNNKLIVKEVDFNGSQLMAVQDSKTGKVYVGVRDSGAFHYHCFHDSCANRKWQDVRLKFEPDAYDDKSRTNGYKQTSDNSSPNFRKSKYEPLNFDEIKANAPKNKETGEPEPEFYTTEMIRLEADEPEEFIKTGITEFDRRNRGLCKGEITCLSGETGSGKSSLLSQLLLDAIEQGYKTALFSGELKRKRVYKWLTYQTAGKKYIHPTQYENFYEINRDCEEPISKWLNEKVYIYNNNYGNLFSFIKSELNKLVTEKKVDLIVLDNLMSMDIDDLSDETNKQQTVFVNQLKRFAESNNVHIIFVAHPKKPQEYRLIGKYDISGSSNMPNLVDNIMIIFRATSSYIKQKAKEFGFGVDEKAGNELRICKDRTGGEMDLFIPLYFEKESRRLKNSPEEIKFYSWRKPKTPYDGENSGMTEVTSEDDLPIM